jgi:hypothetical protein
LVLGSITDENERDLKIALTFLENGKSIVLKYMLMEQMPIGKQTTGNRFEKEVKKKYTYH